MTTPNWQHHSKKEQKRTLKPQAMRQAKKRRQSLKRKLLATCAVLVGVSATPAQAITWKEFWEPFKDGHHHHHVHREVHHYHHPAPRRRRCRYKVRRERYIPGDYYHEGYTTWETEIVWRACGSYNRRYEHW